MLSIWQKDHICITTLIHNTVWKSLLLPTASSADVIKPRPSNME